MGRIVAISSGDLGTTRSLNEYAIKMIKGNTRKVLFIGTASHDAVEYIDNFSKTFTELGCEVRTLQLTTKEYPYEELQETISWADLIYVGGGDTIFMRNVWKKYGVDQLLKEVYEKDSAVLMGISAGAICWFQCGCTDSELAEVKPGATYGWANDMLNLQKYAFCPHYEDRVEDFATLLEEKTIDGLAFESNTAFVEEDGRIYYIKSREAAKAYRFAYKEGKYHQEELRLELVRE